MLIFLTLLTHIKAHYPLQPAGPLIFERIQKITQLLDTFLEKASSDHPSKDLRLCQKLTLLKTQLHQLLESHQDLYQQVRAYYEFIDTIRAICHADTLSEEAALEQFQLLIKKLQSRLRAKALKKQLRTGYEELLKTMKAWKKKLFTFKSLTFLPRTNNSLEQLFREKKAWVRRTSGVKQGNRTFQLFGHYLFFINMALGPPEILNLLNQASYKACWERFKTEKKKATLRYQLAQRITQWDSSFEKLSNKLFMSPEVS